MLVDPNWREYNEDATPKSWGIPSAGLAYISASVRLAGGGIAGLTQFITEKKTRPNSL
jgi:hypothetical protein